MTRRKRAILGVVILGTLALSGCLFIPAVPTGVIEGYVVDAGAGSPVVGAQVRAYPEDSGPPTYWVESDHYGPTAVTNETGYYRLVVPEGTYTVRVEKDGFATSVTHGVRVGSTVKLNSIQKPVFK